MLTHSDVLVLVESLTLIDVDASDVLALNESERLALADPLNDVLILAESLTLVDVDALSDVYLCCWSHSHLLMLTHSMMCLRLLSRSHLLTLTHLMMCLRLLSHSHFVDVDALNDVLALAESSRLLTLMHLMTCLPC